MGRYIPLARVGSGGMAEVYLAVARGPVGFNKLAVLKRVKNTDDPVIVQMFLDEARLAARLNHPNIVHTYEIGEVSEKYYIAMEYLEGQSLHAVLARQQELGEGLVAYVASQALRGLHHAHELRDFDGSPVGVVHRDVSPHNVHITYGGEVKLLDFGIAKTTLNSTHTETGILKGKIRYMAPEQFGEPDVDRRADLFAFGIVIWEMLTRKQLFHGEFSRVMHRIVNEDAPSVRSIRPEISPDLDTIVARALKRDRDERYATAEEMRVDLEAFLRGRPAAEGSYDKDVAAMMGGAFARDRDEVRARIKAFIDALPPGEGSDAGVPATTPSGGELPVIGLGAEAVGGSTTGGSALHRPSVSAAGVAASMPVGETSPARRGFPVWAAAALGAATLGVVVVVARNGHGASPPPAAPAAVHEAQRSHLTLSTAPPGALVVCAGRTLGTTPLETDLPEGTQNLTLSEDGYVTETITLDARPGVAIDRALQLRPIPPAQGPKAASSSAVSAPVHAQGAAPRAVAVPKTTSSAPHRVKIRVLDDTDTP
jgi:eukaryotic-like serine/threonine-protein kinase